MANGPVELKIDDLRLDHDNPRIPVADSQRVALQRILDDQGPKLANLAESIVAEGLSPMDRLLVMKDAGAKTYVVLEGNRRLAALKVLKNAAVLTGLEVPPAIKKRLETASSQFDPASVEPVSCYEMPTRADATLWIQRRHTGEDQGRGIVDWSGEASARFRGRDPALQALEFVREHGSLTDDQRELLSKGFPITTLDRLLSTPDVRKSLGVDVTNGKLTTNLPIQQVVKGLRRVALDLAEKRINVTKLKSKAQQVDYISKLPSTDRPDLAKGSANYSAIDEIASGQANASSNAAAATSKPTASQRSRTTPARTTIVARPARLVVSNPKLAEIYAELKNLKLSSNPHAISVLLRVFIETSTDHYLTKVGISLTIPTQGQGDKEKSLRKKIEEAIAHMETNGASKKDFAGLTKGLSDKNHPLSVDLLHSYVHNRFVTPKERDLTMAWDNALSFLERIWP